jgi:hypothetical protein
MSIALRSIHTPAALHMVDKKWTRGFFQRVEKIGSPHLHPWGPIYSVTSQKLLPSKITELLSRGLVCVFFTLCTSAWTSIFSL